jgi:hypothetical protein
MARQNRLDTLSDRPESNDPAPWALWRLAKVLLEIAQNNNRDSKMEESDSRARVANTSPRIDS